MNRNKIGGIIIVCVIAVIVGVLIANPPQEPTAIPRGRQALRIVYWSSGSIHVIDQDGKNEQRLTDGEAPLWSPDGNKILFCRPGRGWGIINADGTGEVIMSLPREPGEISSNWYRWYQWSPTGQQVILSVECEPHGGIWIANADGGGLRQVLKHEHGVRAATFSPDGRRIAYLAQVGSVRDRLHEDYRLEVINPDGTNRMQLLNDWLHIPGQYYDGLTWSPDGTKITYTVGRSSLYVVNSSGANRVSLGNGDSPVWSPDSQTIAFQIVNALGVLGDDGLYAIKPDGTGRRKIASVVGAAKWSLDGQKIAVGCHIVNVDGTNLTKLAWVDDKGGYPQDWYWPRR